MLSSCCRLCLRFPRTNSWSSCSSLRLMHMLDGRKCRVTGADCTCTSALLEAAQAVFSLFARRSCRKRRRSSAASLNERCQGEGRALGNLRHSRCGRQNSGNCTPGRHCKANTRCAVVCDIINIPTVPQQLALVLHVAVTPITQSRSASVGNLKV